MSTISASTTSTTAYKVSADTTGTLVLQTGSTPTTAVTVGTDQSVTFAQAANLPNTFGFKNRIINGQMQIDQRYAGASIGTSTLAAADFYSLDRWVVTGTQNSKFTLQQTPSATETGYATRVNAGFLSYLACTSSSAYSVGAGDVFAIGQYIEGFNTADLAWGTSNAKTVTLSFWAYSSLTGTFGGSVKNSANNRSYPFSYTISAANTWEQKSITIAGDQSGTWIGATNGVGLRLFFSLGTGSTYSGTAGSWAGANYFSATGATSVVGTNGATFYITGVQLEKGSTATSFDFRAYGTELQLCQRYYCQAKTGTYPGSVQATAFSTSGLSCSASFPVTMRSTPTVVYSQGGTTNQFINVNTAGTVSQTPNQNWWSTTGISGVTGVSTVFTAGLSYGFDYTASAEL